MILLILHGYPGVGKLTIGRELQKLTKYKLFHNHLAVDLVESVFRFGSKPFIKLRELIWIGTFEHASREKIDLIFTFAQEKTVTDGFIKNAIEVVDKNSGKVVFLELTCSNHEIQKRIKSPNRKKFGKLTSVKSFYKLKKSHNLSRLTPPKTHRSFLLDTTNLTPKESAIKILKMLSLK